MPTAAIRKGSVDWLGGEDRLGAQFRGNRVIRQAASVVCGDNSKPAGRCTVPERKSEVQVDDLQLDADGFWRIAGTARSSKLKAPFHVKEADQHQAQGRSLAGADEGQAHQ